MVSPAAPGETRAGERLALPKAPLRNEGLNLVQKMSAHLCKLHERVILSSSTTGGSALALAAQLMR